MSASRLYRMVTLYCTIPVIIFVLYNVIFRAIPLAFPQRNKTLPNVTSLIQSGSGPSFSKLAFKEIKKIFNRLQKEYRYRKKSSWHHNISNASLKTFQGLLPRCRPGLFLLVMVTSRSSALNNRHAIRLSWGNASQNKLTELNRGIGLTFQVIFVLGRSSKDRVVAEESRRFRDVLMVDCKDSNQTAKIIESFSWIARECASKFLVKSNDNTFLNIPGIVNWLTTSFRHDLYVTKFNTNTTPVFGSAKEHYYANKGHNFSYLERSFLLPGKALKKITETIKLFPPVPNSDALVEKLVEFLKIRSFKDSRFISETFESISFRDVEPCEWRGNFFIQHVFRVRHILMYSRMAVLSKLATLACH